MCHLLMSLPEQLVVSLTQFFLIYLHGLQSTCTVIVAKYTLVTGPRETAQIVSLLSCTKWYLTLF